MAHSFILLPGINNNIIQGMVNGVNTQNHGIAIPNSFNDNNMEKIPNK